MDALRQIIAHFGIEVDTKQVHAGDTEIDGLIQKLSHFGHAVAGVFAFHQVESFVKATVDEARALDKASTMAGMAAQDLQKLQHAFNMADVDAGELSAGLRFLQRNSAAAAAGSAEAAKSFKELGISFEPGKSKNTAELLYEVTDAIAGIQDPAQRTQKAMQIFGRGGLTMMPALMQGSEKLREYAEGFAHLGGGFSEDFMKKSDEFEAHEKELALLWRSMRSQLVGQLIPAFLQWGKALEQVGLAALKLNKDGSLMRVVWAGALGAIIMKLPVLISLMRGFAASTLLPLAGLVLAALAAEDLLTWFQGGDSVIGRFFAQFTTGTDEAGVALGDFFAFAFSSWENFDKAGNQAWSAIHMTFKSLAIDFDEWVSGSVAKFLDSLVDAGRLVADIVKWIGTGEVTVRQDSTQFQDQAAKDTAGARGRWDQELDAKRNTPGSAYNDYQTAMAALKADRGWAAQGYDARNGPYHWNAALGAPEAATMPVPPASIARTEITDNSKTEVKVDVHGVDPATAPKKIGAAVAKATKTDYNGASMSLEHTVD